jgi:hypothetical protein
MGRIKHLLFLSLLLVGFSVAYSPFGGKEEGEEKVVPKEDASIIFSQPLTGGTTSKRTKRAPTEFSESSFVGSNYDEDTNRWTFKLAVFTAYPYSPEINNISYTLGSASVGRSFNGNAFNLSECVEDPQSKDCFQEFEFTANGCEAFDFKAQYNVNATCRSNLNSSDLASCQATAPTTSTSVDLSLYSSSSCSIERLVSFSPSLSSYTSPSLDESTTKFNASDNIYFGAKLQLNPEVLETVTINRVCAYQVAPNPSTECTNNVTFSLISNVASFDAAFQVKAGDLRTLAGLTDNSTFTVQIDVLLSYKDASSNKRNVKEEPLSAQATLAVYDSFPMIPQVEGLLDVNKKTLTASKVGAFLDVNKKTLTASKVRGLLDGHKKTLSGSNRNLGDLEMETSHPNPSSSNALFSHSFSIVIFIFINVMLIFN